MRLRIFAYVRFEQFPRVAHRRQQQNARHNFQESQRRIHRPHVRNSNRTCHTPPHPRQFSIFAFSPSFFPRLHQGICLNTPARTNAASTNASSTAHASIEKPRCFTGTAACICSLIVFLLSVFQNNPIRHKFAQFCFRPTKRKPVASSDRNTSGLIPAPNSVTDCEATL